MRHILQASVLILLTGLPAFGQHELFIPPKPEGLSEETYREGIYILKNSYQQVVDDNYNVVTNDNWNFAVAYAKLGQSKEMVYDFLYQSKSQDRNFFCTMIAKLLSDGKAIEETMFYKLLGEDFNTLTADCSAVTVDEKNSISMSISRKTIMTKN